ncbi:hypothetical protein GALMADRAFT_230854 [Galerina marginata CBS 339.88]|uniref:Uncharacterized protein n=1 Tax=Galerina marginata (strain CBS 339.88) TaxID=685588 RepID=A0A067SQI1_GALM3|nr:hypothetical protein GALMADRAFT_230854 [Galerina marginata CBS 339.88]
MNTSTKNKEGWALCPLSIAVSVARPQLSVLCTWLDFATSTFTPHLARASNLCKFYWNSANAGHRWKDRLSLLTRCHSHPFILRPASRISWGKG